MGKDRTKRGRKPSEGPGKKRSIIALISFGVVMTVLTVASDFLDFVLIWWGWIGLLVAIMVTFTFFILVYHFGLKGNL